MSRVYEIADRYTLARAGEDPIWATSVGIAGFDGEVTDYSPDAARARRATDDAALGQLKEASAETDRDRIARDLMVERLGVRIAQYDSGAQLCDLSVSILSPSQKIRLAFDTMATESNDGWELIAERMTKVPNAVRGYVESLRLGMTQGVVASRRQALAVARQCLNTAGLSAGSSRYFGGLVDRYEARQVPQRRLVEDMRKASIAADEAYGELAAFLSGEYAGAAATGDGVGRDRYALAALGYLGEEVDLDQTYEWGWHELHSIDAEIRSVCHEILPGASLQEVTQMLDEDHERWINGEAALVSWLQSLLDHAIDRLHPEHFEIPEAFRRIEVRIAPPGGPANQYYTPPSQDFSRPGIYWYPTAGHTRFSMWSQISTAFHEGVPGHHLQQGWAKFCIEDLSQFQRAISVDGHCEGWALYAERLADELGLLSRPEYRLDMLTKSLFRAARVVIDIGLHLGLTIPSDSPFRPGQKWTPDVASELLASLGGLSEELVASEVDRYLGVPAQAISYKLGERAWLEARAAAKSAQGDSFDLRAFHKRALSLGPLGLVQLRQELARPSA